MPQQTFGPFQFDATRFLLSRGGAPVAMGRRAGMLLALLLSRRGEVISKEELIEAAWPDRVVEEANLSVQISSLRKAIGKRPDGREWIATVQRIGYRFLPEANVAAPRFRYPVLAILPFTDFDTDAESEARGFAEDLTTAMSRLGSISVSARIASFLPSLQSENLTTIANRLGADYVVEGSRRKTSGRLRTNVQLIDGRTGAHVWAEMFDETARGGFGEQLVERVAAALEAKIYAEEVTQAFSERPTRESAYALYLRARRFFFALTERDNAQAYRLLGQALQLEPHNIYIIASAAGALHHRISVGWPALTGDDQRESLNFARRGAELAGGDGARLAMFPNAMFTARAHDLGRATMERALTLNGGSVMALGAAGLGYLFMGENERAEAYFEEAATLGYADPGLCFSLGGLASIQRRKGNHERAIELASRSLAAGPTYSCAYWHLIASSMHLGRVEDAKRYLKRFREISPATTVASIRAGQPVVDERLIIPLLDALAEAGLPEV